MNKLTIVYIALTVCGTFSLVIFFLLILGYRPLIPDGAVEPNWDAFQTLSTIFLSLVTLGLTWCIAKRQENLTKEQEKLSLIQEEHKKQAERERFQIKKSIAEKELKAKELDLKISLYDKRYRVYECFRKYPFDKIEEFAIAGTNTAFLMPDGGRLNGAEATRMLIFGDRYINGRRQLLDELRMLEDKKNLTNAEQRKKNNLHNRILFENLDYWNSEIALIEQAEFCFDESEAQMLIAFIKVMFEYANPIGDQYDVKQFEELQMKLIKSIEDIKNNQLIDKLKDKLTLSYNEINT
jgi:hypothetical protein